MLRLLLEEARNKLSFELSFLLVLSFALRGLSLGPPGSLLGSLRSEDGDGSENVAEKVNSRSLNLHRDYSKSLT